MPLTFTDLSDNNPIQSTFTGLDGVFLKLYPIANSKGFGWLGTQWSKAQDWAGAHPGFVIGFYAADSTPTWASAKASASALGVDLNKHPFAFDLREFGFTTAYVKGQVTDAHADGQVNVGHYWRLSEEVGQDWRWKADYSGTPAEPWFLHQYTDAPLDHSRTHDGVTLDTFLAATTDVPAPPPPGGDDLTPDQEAQLKQASDAGYIAQQEAKHHGIDTTPGKPWRDQLAKIRAKADRVALGVTSGDTPIPTDLP